MFGLTADFADEEPEHHARAHQGADPRRRCGSTPTTARTAPRRSRSCRSPDYVGADADGDRQLDDRHLRVRQGRQARRRRTSTSSSATTRAIPFYSDAVWYLTQMRRWGQIPEAKPDAWYDETAKAVYRPAIYARGRAAAGRRGQGRRGRTFPSDTDGFRAPTADFIDGIDYDGRKPERLPREASRSGSRTARPSAAPACERLMEAADDPRPRHRSTPTASAVPAACARGSADRRASSTRSGSAFLAPLVQRGRGRRSRRQHAELRAAARRAAGRRSSLFLLAWGQLAPRVQTSLGALPGPGAGLGAGGGAASGPTDRQQKRPTSTSARRRATPSSPPRGQPVKVHAYTGKPTFYRPDLHLAQDRVLRLRDRHAGRGAARHPLRPVADGQRRRSTR